MISNEFLSLKIFALIIIIDSGSGFARTHKIEGLLDPDPDEAKCGARKDPRSVKNVDPHQWIRFRTFINCLGIIVDFDFCVLQAASWPIQKYQREE